MTTRENTHDTIDGQIETYLEECEEEKRPLVFI